MGWNRMGRDRTVWDGEEENVDDEMKKKKKEKKKKEKEVKREQESKSINYRQNMKR